MHIYIYIYIYRYYTYVEPGSGEGLSRGESGGTICLTHVLHPARPTWKATISKLEGETQAGSYCQGLSFQQMIGGSHLSNTTCLTHGFFKGGE